MKALIILSIVFVSNSSFAAPKEKISRFPSSEAGESFCKANPSKCVEFMYPTVSFSGATKYKIAFSKEHYDVISTSFCVDAGFKSYAAGVIGYIKDSKELFYDPEYNSLSKWQTNGIIEKIVCSPM